MQGELSINLKKIVYGSFLLYIYICITISAKYEAYFGKNGTD